ncbi:glycosyltransferase family 2 protein [Halomonas daqiaonensis]|uniref:Glycosyltransferase, catalytic subunit of cellulose synthase and poly-beta-1,6-N-acetylglucosamine synthase n=1 Tax=Halomonas daqiaonensis TaxID=650850 RepID=A0A1H7LSI4_9GAMM|nr:glycosyltransferase [Halomonas daqiaonensis]SEL01327.1 Glycosyltransferase, catalytic subunit of cellulose synthase and poly-beta-1,6-N-acetylglucosamine synthase [Halomonas daqiaonensis]
MIESALSILYNSSWQALLAFFWYFFLLELPRYTFSTLAVGIAAIFQTQFPKTPAATSISVLLVGMDDPGGLRRSVLSLREQTHQALQVVVVEDGGGTAMSSIAQNFRDSGLIDQYIATGVRGGKAAALNLGFHYCRHETLVVMDIDTSLDRDAIDQITRRLYSSPDIGAVAGNLGVQNPRASLWTEFQSLEYFTAISMGRQFLAMFGLLTIVSGAFGAFRKSAIQQVGGWDVGPGDDSNLTLKLRRSGWSIAFEPHAWCLTAVPTRFKALHRQRLRWNRSLIRNRLRKFKHVFYPNQENFFLRDVAASLSQLFYNFVLSVSYVAYIIYLIENFGSSAVVFFIATHLLIFVAGVFEFIVGCATIGRREFFRLWPYLFGWSVFMGIIMRFNRLEAYFSELIFRKSYDDDFYPHKVRAQQDQF